MTRRSRCHLALPARGPGPAPQTRSAGREAPQAPLQGAGRRRRHLASETGGRASLAHRSGPLQTQPRLALASVRRAPPTSPELRTRPQPTTPQRTRHPPSSSRCPPNLPSTSYVAKLPRKSNPTS